MYFASILVHCLLLVTCRLISVAALKMQALMKGGMAMEDARNKCSVQMVRAAKVNSPFVVLHRI